MRGSNAALISNYFDHFLLLGRTVVLCTYMRPIVTDRAECGLSVGRSVSLSVTLVSLAKTAAPIEMPFGLRTVMGPGNRVLHGGQIPPWEVVILRGKGASHCKA